MQCQCYDTMFLASQSEQSSGFQEHGDLFLCNLSSPHHVSVQLPALAGETGLRATLCNSSVDRFLEFNSTSQRQEFQNVTCSLTPNQLQQTRAVLMQNLDNRKLLAVVSKSYVFYYITTVKKPQLILFNESIIITLV